jgi:hypothetical protein
MVTQVFAVERTQSVCDDDDDDDDDDVDVDDSSLLIYLRDNSPMAN